MGKKRRIIKNLSSKWKNKFSSHPRFRFLVETKTEDAKVEEAEEVEEQETDVSATKILAVKPDGAGNNTAISQGYNKIGFKAAAVLGSSFSVTCISTTAAVAWLAHDVIDGLAANVGSINLA